MSRDNILKNFSYSKNIELPNLMPVGDWLLAGRPDGQWFVGAIKQGEGQRVWVCDHQGEFELPESWDQGVFYLQNLEGGSFQRVNLTQLDKVALRRAGDTLEVVLLGINTQESSQLPQTKWLRALHWHQFKKKVDEFFRSRGFLPVQTPNLVVCPGMEISLDPFNVELKIGEASLKRYLPTSPEIHLKKALAKGASKVYEIKTCYRNGEKGFQHLPEFTMLEWYRSYCGLNDIKNDIRELILFLVPEAKETKFIFSEKTIAELFKEKLGFNLTPETRREDLFLLAKKIELHTQPEYSWDDLFSLIFIDKIEGSLGKETIDFVSHYPPSQAALAKLTTEGWADRFELYWQGYEIANAFNELTDPAEQLRRFKEEQKQKAQLGKDPLAIDYDFIEHLKMGLPPTSGIALGLERLYMALYGLKDINEIGLFPPEPAVG